jgi:hypothetical protein
MDADGTRVVVPRPRHHARAAPGRSQGRAGNQLAINEIANAVNLT